MNLLRSGRILLLLALLGSSTGVILQCNYTLSGSAYPCQAQVIFVGDSRAVTEVSHNHLAGKNNSDVTQLHIINQVVGFIPNNVSEFFPNLDYFDVFNTAVAEITRDSLKGLHRLRIFYADWNRIKSIGSDLFADNLELQEISFYSNPIKHVAHRVFDHLTQLKHLNFAHTACINSDASGRTATVQLILKLPISCPPTFEMIETQIVNGEMLEEKFIVARNETDQQIRVLIQRLELLEGSGRK